MQEINVFNDRTMPVKIFYLKAQKHVPKQQLQNPSLAVLSSFIQDQKNLSSSKYLLDKQKSKNTAKVIKPNTSYLPVIQKFQIDNKKRNKTIYKQKIKDQQIALTDLLGQNWEKYQNAIILDQSQKQQSNINKMLALNRKMLKKHFELFLENKAKPKKIQQKKDLSITIPYKHRDEWSFEIDKQQKIVQKLENYSQVKKNQFNQKRKSSPSLNSRIVMKMNFKQIDNFNWSKVNFREKRFSLKK